MTHDTSQIHIAVIIENYSQLLKYKKMCSAHGIILASTKIDSLEYPHHQLLYKAGTNVFSIYNDVFQDGEYSVIGLGYVPYSLLQFASKVSSLTKNNKQ